MYIVKNITGTKFRIKINDSEFLSHRYLVQGDVPYEFDTYIEAEEFLHNWRDEHTWIKVKSPQ